MIMKKMNVVLSASKMAVISNALELMLKHATTKTNNPKLVMEKVEDQAVKSFGNFAFSLEDTADITLSVHWFWTLSKKNLLSSSRPSAWWLRKIIQSILAEFTGIYMSICPNVKEGINFRKIFYVSTLDANC